MHETKFHTFNSFITLTFDDESVPPDHSLSVEHLQKFFRRFRKAGHTVRYYACGEYGEQTLRPHYHACVFGFAFPDRLPITTETASNPLYVSPFLQTIWPYGKAVIGDLTFESAAYVARYCTKKVTGKQASSHYERVIESTGEVVNVQPEFALMSRKPGVGAEWFEKYGSEVYPNDRVIVRGRKAKPPRYYDSILEKHNPKLYELIKNKRKLDTLKYLEQNVTRSLSDRELFATLKAKTFSKRDI